MHISEGILSPGILLAGALVSAGGIGIGLKRMSERDVPAAALMTAFFFVGSLVHIPIGPASGHLVLNGLLGLVLGWKAWPAIFVALVLQAVLFQFGGITTLGVNTCIIALPGVVFGLAANHLITRLSQRLKLIAAGSAAALSVLSSALLAAMVLYMTGEGFEAPARLLILSHIPVAVVEGIVTAFICSFILKVKPEIFSRQAAMVVIIVIPLLTLAPFSAYAHRVNIFALIKGEYLQGEGYFSSGRKCAGCRVVLYDSKGRKIGETETDENGMFRFKCPGTEEKIRLVLDAGTGHRAETEVDLKIGEEKGGPRPVAHAAYPGIRQGKDAHSLEEILDRKLEPLYRELKELRKDQEKTTFKDVASGLGYIFGLMGLALYGFGRRK